MSAVGAGGARDRVVLVDADDRPTGVADKLQAHRAPGLRHRALSVFVLDGQGRTILQRRAASKYHFAGLWSNSCCTHPAPDEPVVGAGERRLVEELGLRSRLRPVGVFTYRAVDPVSGLVEHEVDHVLVGSAAGPADPDPHEVAEVRAVALDELDAWLRSSPAELTPWLPAALAVVRAADLDLDLGAGPTPALDPPLDVSEEDPA